MSGTSVKHLSSAQVKALLDAGETFRLIDVREPDEHAIAQIAGAELLPLSRAQEWLPTLEQDEPVVFMCHHGGRSQQVANYAVSQLGLTNVSNMLGGIEDWAVRVDPQVPRY